MTAYNPYCRKQPEYVELQCGEKCFLPHEFAAFTGSFGSIEEHDSRESPELLHAILAAGNAIILTGPYRYADAVFRYCKRYERRLIADEQFAHVADLSQRSAAFTAERRRKLHRLFLLARGDSLIDIEGPPETTGLQKWLLEQTGDEIFLIPIRRLQRILTDMQRAREGIFMEILGGSLTILPHVYVPTDRTVPAMFGKYRHLIEGKTVLDMGTGTGVLAILAAKLGAASVVAVDSNPNAVDNARLNVQRFGMDEIIEVRGPADLFDPVQGDRFDVIIFNAPWIQGEPQTLYDTANYDPGYHVLDSFLKNAPEYLAGDGAILLQYSDLSQRKGEEGIAHLEKSVESNGLRIAGKYSIVRLSRVLGAREHVFLFEIRK